jgi:hypothetical protein
MSERERERERQRVLGAKSKSGSFNSVSFVLSFFLFNSVL